MADLEYAEWRTDDFTAGGQAVLRRAPIISVDDIGCATVEDGQGVLILPSGTWWAVARPPRPRLPGRLARYLAAWAGLE